MPDSQHELPDRPAEAASERQMHPPEPDPTPTAAQADEAPPSPCWSTEPNGRHAPSTGSSALLAEQSARSASRAAVPAEDPDEDEAESSTRLHVIVGSLIGAAVIIAILLGVLTQAKSNKLEPGKPVPGTEATTRLLAGIPQHGFTLGVSHAPLTLTEFGDLMSSTSAAFAKEGIPKMISKYVRPGRLRIVFRPVSLMGQESERAAQMAAALAQQDRMWQFVDLMYRNQGPEETAYVTESYLAAITTAIPGARLAPAVQARESTEVRSELRRDSSQAHRLHLSSTPAFLLSRTGGASQRVTAAQVLDPTAFSEAIKGLKG